MPENHMEKLYTSKNPLVKFVHTTRLNQIVQIVPNKNMFKILDAGCGEGHLIKKLNDKHNKNEYYGIDILDIPLNKAKKRCPYAKLKKMDLRETSFNDEFFDIIICSETLEHVPEVEIAIKELKRILKKDGYLIITFPNETLWTVARFLLGRRPIRVPDHVNSFNPKKISSLTKMRLISVINLPFKFPFFISLGCLMMFKK